MTSGNGSRVATALTVAIGIFLIAIVLPKFIFSATTAKMAATQGLELSLALLAILVFGKGRFSEYGFCFPQADKADSYPKYRWMLISATAPFLGMAATISILALGAGGHPFLKKLSLIQIILFVWVFSSIIEEIFTRGFLQGHLSALSRKYVTLPFCRIELPVLISALFFASMHFVLLFSGVDATTMVVIFLFTFSLGLMAGHLRSKTGSLIPAIAVHMLANIGGMIGGIIYTIINFMLTGELPNM